MERHYAKQLQGEKVGEAVVSYLSGDTYWLKVPKPRVLPEVREERIEAFIEASLKRWALSREQIQAMIDARKERIALFEEEAEKRRIRAAREAAMRKRGKRA